MDRRERTICARSGSNEWSNTDAADPRTLVVPELFFGAAPLRMDQHFTNKKKKQKKKVYFVFTFADAAQRGKGALCAHVATMRSQRRRRQGRKRLFVAANTSVSDGNTGGAALRQISLPIS